MLESLTRTLRRGELLGEERARDAVAALVNDSIAPETKADFLTAFAVRGETPEEIAVFARELSARAINVPLDAETRAGEILDVCGTGGDHLNTFNISTTVGLVLSGGGVVVAKHGNRAITSKSGSADVLEALGVRIDLTPAETARWLRDYQFAFFFAPHFHPVFKHIAPARKLCAQRGQRTIFNYLGPLLNPARPSAQLIGVSTPDLCEPLAHVLQTLGVRRGMVVCGRVPSSDGAQLYLDEISTLGNTTIAEYYQERGFIVSELSNHTFSPATLQDLAGGDCHRNAAIIKAILNGEDRGARRDAVLVNAGAAFFVAGKCRTITEGIDLASATLDRGDARAKLIQLVQVSSS